MIQFLQSLDNSRSALAGFVGEVSFLEFTDVGNCGRAGQGVASECVAVVELNLFLFASKEGVSDLIAESYSTIERGDQ